MAHLTYTTIQPRDRPSGTRYYEEEEDTESPVFRAQTEAAKLAQDLAREVGYGDEESDEEHDGGGGGRARQQR